MRRELNFSVPKVKSLQRKETCQPTRQHKIKLNEVNAARKEERKANAQALSGEGAGSWGGVNQKVADSGKNQEREREKHCRNAENHESRNNHTSKRKITVDCM